MNYHQWLGVALAFTLLAYFVVLAILLRRGWPLRAGLASLVVSIIPMWADMGKGGGGAYGLVFVTLMLAIFPQILIAVGLALGAVRAFKHLRPN